MINKVELKLLEDFAFGETSEEDFLRNYPVNLVEEKNYLIDLMNVSIEKRDEDNLDLLLDVMVLLTLYEDFDFQSVFRSLIRENWHRMHESLVDSLDKTEANEDAFIHVLSQTYDYHADGVEDFMVPIWSKCLWSLYTIGNEKGKKEIQKCRTSEYDYLRNTADKLWSRLK